jgi:hypothetical protein
MRIICDNRRRDFFLELIRVAHDHGVLAQIAMEDPEQAGSRSIRPFTCHVCGPCFARRTAYRQSRRGAGTWSTMSSDPIATRERKGKKTEEESPAMQEDQDEAARDKREDEEKTEEEQRIDPTEPKSIPEAQSTGPQPLSRTECEEAGRTWNEAANVCVRRRPSRDLIAASQPSPWCSVPSGRDAGRV